MMEHTPETSVMFSLAELARIEDERVREEEAQQARAGAQRAREQEAELARRRSEEALRIARETEARAERTREEAARDALLEARKRAEIDAVRIAAEAKARLEADDARRAHELTMLRTRLERRAGRVRYALLAGIVVLLLGGAIGWQRLASQVRRLEQEAAALRIAEREREQALANERASLEERHGAALRERDDHRDKARMTELDRRYDDLAAWAAQRGKSTLAQRARRARAHGGDGYGKALDELAAALAGTAMRPRPVAVEEARPRCTDPNDPMCGLDGTLLR